MTEEDRVEIAVGSRVAAVALPAKRLTVGRPDEISRLADVVLDEEAGPALVMGPPGVGKTNLTIAALHDPVVAARFGDRRYFVRCDGASDASALVAELAVALRVPMTSAGSGANNSVPGTPGDPSHLEDAAALPYALGTVRAALARSPALVVVDNAETPWEPDPLRTENVLATLTDVPGVRVVVSLRGSERPGGPLWASPFRLQPLSLDSARELFLRVAGDGFDTEGLDELLEDMGGLPLAIELLARVAETEPGITDLARLWHEHRTRLLARASGDHRSLSIAVSAEVSWDSPLLSDLARRLLSLLSVLPDGIAHEDLDRLLPGVGTEAAHRLRQRALAFDVAGRLRTHPPLGHHIVEAHPPENRDHERAQRHYIDLVAQYGGTVGRPGGAEAVGRLTSEAANIGYAFTSVLEEGDPTPALDAVHALAEFARTGALPNARAAFDTAIMRSDMDGGIQRQAETRDNAARVARHISDLDTARRLYTEALPLYRRTDDVLGEAYCIRGLGHIALQQEDLHTAQTRYVEALSLFRKIGAVLGEANCIRGLGHIALEQSEHATAGDKFNEALPLFRHIGSVVGEATCVAGMGHIALAQSNYATAGDKFNEALPLFRQIGSVVGEADCILSLGDIALERSDHATAYDQFKQALSLYERLPEPASVGRTHRRLARLASGDSDRARHVAAAREAWTQIKRSDLVADLDNEFN